MYFQEIAQNQDVFAVADPGFPVGAGCGLLRQLRFENIVCQNERIWTLRGERRRAPGTPPKSANDLGRNINL